MQSQDALGVLLKQVSGLLAGPLWSVADLRRSV